MRCEYFKILESSSKILGKLIETVCSQVKKEVLMCAKLSYEC